MKITYFQHVKVEVTFDGTYRLVITDCPINELHNRVEDEMWDHHFDHADVCDAYTGELIMTIEKG